MSDAPSEPGRRLGHRPDAPVPLSTYRVQLNADFTFADAQSHLPYFASLGVSHLYLSPILEAAPGSTHYYDVVDHSSIAGSLGGMEGLRSLAAMAREHGIGLVADVVPNHMAVSTPVYHNRALWSVLQHGSQSPFAHWFDVDWTSSESVLMPILGSRIGTCLAAEEITLDSMVIPGHEDAGEVPVLRYFEHVFPVRPETASLPLAELVDQQHYRLAYWRVANEELNYRRFFDVGSLVALRVEDDDVFDQTHRVLVDLVKDGTLDGLRIDHPDGLANPERYFERLAEATDRAWVVAEKILEGDERLPGSWKVAGTTGYDASWRIGALLRDPAGAAPLGGTLHRLSGDALGSFPDVIDEAKREIVKETLSAEVHRLSTLAHDVCMADIRLRDHTYRALHDCLRAMLVVFDRYRAYVIPGLDPSPSETEVLDAAAERARAILDEERHETLEAVVDLLKGLEVGSAGKRADAKRTELVTRFQQACGAVMAKGVEDTAYYRWTHLLSLCEVGSPAPTFALPPASFHAWAAERQVQSPHAMTSLTTHDTKRSEDVRARLGVLSEAPDEWDALVRTLERETSAMRPFELDGRTENLWWQTLAATAPGGHLLEWDRLAGYLTKAMREAKTRTSWLRVDEVYEQAVLDFCEETHADATVRALIVEWDNQTHEATRAAILAQRLLHATIPGIPDIYQGNESLAPSLVDPDNRRPVDLDCLATALTRLDEGARPRTLAEEKLWVTACALRVRRERPQAFIGECADYLPLASSSGHAVVAARTVGNAPEVVSIATRSAWSLGKLGGWGEATLQLPEGSWRDVLTDTVHPGGSAPIGALLRSLPVALLTREP